MGRPVVTAILLDDLLRTGKPIALPKEALITPAARDWFRDHPVPVTWLDGEGCGQARLALVMEPKLTEMRALRTMLDRQGGVADVIEPMPGTAGLAAATRRLCGKIVRREVTKGVVFATDGAVPVCVANKHKGIRAALGMSVPMVEEAIRELGINVLVIEYPEQTPYRMRQMIKRLATGATAPKPELVAVLEAIEQGGGRADW
jgi:ribose 5-phosphate isomerase RpiB